MSNRNLVLVANCILTFGVFCPIVTIPFLGGQNYFQDGHGDGIIVLTLALVGFVLIFKGWFRALFVTSGLSLLVCLFTFVTLLARLSSMRDQLRMELKGNPFAGLAEVAMKSVQIQWGWALLIGGSAMLIVTSWKSEKEQQRFAGC